MQKNCIKHEWLKKGEKLCGDVLDSVLSNGVVPKSISLHLGVYQ
jgi:hypothetical protein